MKNPKRTTCIACGAKVRTNKYGQRYLYCLRCRDNLESTGVCLGCGREYHGELDGLYCPECRRDEEKRRLRAVRKW